MDHGSKGFPGQETEYWGARIGDIVNQDWQDILYTGTQLGKLLDSIREQGKRQRIADWRERMRKADAGGQGVRLKDWVDPQEGEYIVAVETAQGRTVIRPAEVAQAFVDEWGQLWKPGPEVEELDSLCRQLASTAPELPDIKGEDIAAALRAMPGRKASGLDAWTLHELRRMTPGLREALADILNKAEKEGGPPGGPQRGQTSLPPQGQREEGHGAAADRNPPHAVQTMGPHPA